MDIRKIKKLIELLENSDISEIKISEGEESLRICRYHQQAPVTQYISPPQQNVAVPAVPQVSAAVASDDSFVASTSDKLIRSPMVGTFYAAASPEADDFVRVGDAITTGDTVCIIEAMKMFNRIEAEFAGKIKEILVENGQPVEYDEPLFLVA